MLDFDRDSASDLMINHLDRPLALLRNETKTDGLGLQLELVGTASERDAIGARVVVSVGGQQRIAWVTAGDGYMCSDEPVLEFGLGRGGKVAQIEVHWPSGKRQTFDGPAMPGRYLIIEGQPELFPRPWPVPSARAAPSAG